MSEQQLLTEGKKETTPPVQRQEVQDERRFLKENWKVILGSDCPEHLRFVRVNHGVANVTNGKVLIRYPMPYLPDGFYTINETGAITAAASGSSPGWMLFPDVEACRPSFSTITPSVPIPNQVISELVSFVEYVRNQKSNEYAASSFLVMNRDGVFSSADTQVSFALPLRNLPSGEDVLLSPFSVKLALVEMLRYPEVYISQEAGAGKPLILGTDWGHCALVKPHLRDIDRWRGGGVPYH